jgi:pyridoxal phosphate enzyme (YggS family)
MWCRHRPVSPVSLSASAIQQNIAIIRERIRTAARTAGRDPANIRLIAASKTMSAETVRHAMQAGQHCFGESTIQDAQTKLALIEDAANEWHFIGHLQTNKAKLIPGSFSWLHTLDSLKLAKKLSDSTVKASTGLNVLLQVNIANDPDKFGLSADAVYPFTEQLLAADYPGIRLQGLMTIGRRDASQTQRRADFSALRKLGNQCAERFGTDYFSELSMGMSGDFEAAIAEGATMVRIGKLIFGPRPATVA